LVFKIYVYSVGVPKYSELSHKVFTDINFNNTAKSYCQNSLMLSQTNIK